MASDVSEGINFYQIVMLFDPKASEISERCQIQGDTSDI
jgi:hypothetical protein